MDLLQSVMLTCPYCGESIETTVDTSLSSQRYIEDCPVCCRPITLHPRCAPAEVIEISVWREDEC
jgi:transposase-like protein